MKWLKRSNYRLKLAFALFILSLASPFTNFAQDQDLGKSGNLNEQFKELKTSSESFKQYKVIETYKLNSFWNVVKDSLSAYNGEITSSNNQIEQLNSQVATHEAKINELQEALEKSEAFNNQISFLGVDLSKSFYNIVVWSVIGGLIVAFGFLFVSFKRSNMLTLKSKKDLGEVRQELENLRKSSHDKQIKLGRELQTARNELEEMKESQKKKEKASA